MVKITKEDILKLAKLSQISVTNEEVDALTKRIDTLLNYVSCIQEVSKGYDFTELSHRNINVMRPDIIIKTEEKPLLDLAPDSQDNYFVVPTIIKS